MMKSGLVIGIVTILSSMGSAVEYGGYVFDNPNKNFKLNMAPKTEILSAKGNCAAQRLGFLSETWHLVVLDISESVTNEVAKFLFDTEGHLLIQSNVGALPACGPDKNVVSVESANGLKTLKVKCSGNALKGEGSGKFVIKTDMQGKLKEISVDYQNGWYDGLSKGKISCSF